MSCSLRFFDYSSFLDNVKSSTEEEPPRSPPLLLQYRCSRPVMASEDNTPNRTRFPGKKLEGDFRKVEMINQKSNLDIFKRTKISRGTQYT